MSEESSIKLTDIYGLVQSPYSRGDVSLNTLIFSILRGEINDYPCLTIPECETYNDLVRAEIFNVWKKGMISLSKDQITEKFSGHINQIQELIKKLKEIDDMVEFDHSVIRNLEIEFPEVFEKFYSERVIGLDVFEICSYDLNRENLDLLSQHVLSLNIKQEYFSKFLLEFIKECSRLNKPFYINVGKGEYFLSVDGPYNDTIQLIASDELLPDYIQILRDIREKNPDIDQSLGIPLITAGKIDGYIGYYSDVVNNGRGVYSAFAYGLARKSEIKDIQQRFLKMYFDKEFDTNEGMLTFAEYTARILSKKFLENSGFNNKKMNGIEIAQKKLAVMRKYDKKIYEDFKRAVLEICDKISSKSFGYEPLASVSLKTFDGKSQIIKIEIEDIIDIVINSTFNATIISDFKGILNEKGYDLIKPCFTKSTIKRVENVNSDNPVNESSENVCLFYDEADIDKMFGIEDQFAFMFGDQEKSEVKTKSPFTEYDSLVSENDGEFFQIDLAESIVTDDVKEIDVFVSIDGNRKFIHKRDAEELDFIPLIKTYENYYPITEEDLENLGVKATYRTDLELPKVELEIYTSENGDETEFYIGDYVICQTELQTIKITEEQIAGKDILIPRDVVELYSLYYDVKFVPDVGTTKLEKCDKAPSLMFAKHETLPKK